MKAKPAHQKKPYTSILSMPELIGYMEMDEDLWELWKQAEKFGEAEDFLRRGHELAEEYIFNRLSEWEACQASIDRKKWHIASTIARLLKIHHVHGFDARYPHPRYDSECTRGGFVRPGRFHMHLMSEAVFPFMEGRGIIRSDNPNIGEQAIEAPYQ